MMHPLLPGFAVLEYGTELLKRLKILAQNSFTGCSVGRTPTIFNATSRSQVLSPELKLAMSISFYA